MQKSTDPLPSWDDLRVFLAVARTQSITAAARSLHIEQSTVSRRLKRLENALDLLLFDRTPEGSQLTEAGYTLLTEAEAAEHHITQLSLNASHLQTSIDGTVHLALTDALASFFIIPRLSSLLTQHPHLRLQLHTGMHRIDLLRREADIAIRNIPPTHPDLVSRKLVTLSCGPYAHRSYLAQSPWPCPPESLDWIALGPPHQTLPETAWITQTLHITPRIELQSLHTHFSAVQSGLGVGLLTHSAAHLDPDLVPLQLPHDPPPPFTLYITVHRTQRLIPRVRAVMDWLIELFKTLPTSPPS